jgi:hypothetical protein
VVELLVESMREDRTQFHELWLAAGAPDGATDVGPGIAGRRDELSVVRAHLESGSGLLLVTGEAGIGRTRLVATAQRSTPEVLVVQSQCLPLSTEDRCCRSPTSSVPRGSPTVAACSKLP